MDNGKTILSLCDYLGNWTEPYRNAGYNVIQIDIKHGQDVRLLKHPGRVHGILAAPPCTHFAIVGARHWKSKTDEQLAEGLAVIDACIRLATICEPKWWALENPVGRLKYWLGEPAFKFQPFWYGDPWTKYTCLWGDFIPPLPVFIGENKQVEPEKFIVKSGRKYGRTLAQSGQDRSAKRAETPKGFAMAFFKANP